MRKNINKVYIWYHDKKIIGMMIVAITISFQIFAFLKIHFLSSIHGYTIGMMLGFYNPFFYMFMTYIGLNIISEGKFKLPQWFKLNPFSYWIVALSIVFINATILYYQGKTGHTTIGTQTWDSFDKWYQNFTSNKNAWFPVNTNGGIIGVFMYSFFAMIISEIGALIFSIIMIVISTSYVATSSSIGFYKWSKSSKRKNTTQISLNNKKKEVKQQNYQEKWNSKINLKRWDSETDIKR